MCYISAMFIECITGCVQNVYRAATRKNCSKVAVNRTKEWDCKNRTIAKNVKSFLVGLKKLENPFEKHCKSGGFT